MNVVDASVWVSAFLPADCNHQASDDWLEQQRHRGAIEMVAPALLLAEVAGAVVRSTGSFALAEAAIERLLGLPELRLELMDDELSLTAAYLAARLRLRGADSIYVALADRLGLALVTWDGELLGRASSAVHAAIPGQERPRPGLAP